VAELPVPVRSLIAGRYRVDAVIGSGSMGVVAAGYNLELEQPVAIKFLSVATFATKDALARFRREVRAAAKIKSEHVARVLDVGALESGLPYMVMEYLEGHDLGDELAVRGQLSVAEAALYVLEASEAIAEAHAASIVHRDLKPANLFLALRADRSRLVKVLDFGISKTLGDDPSSGEVGLTRTGMIVGSPLYMAPEQLGSSRVIDWRADIWGLGGILFQLVTGRTAFSAPSAAELYAMLLRDRPTPLSHYRADVPPAFEAIVQRCLERDPAQRFEDVSALADALVPFAPPDAAVHADRARGVLHAGRVSSGRISSSKRASSSGRVSSLSGSATHLSSSPPVVMSGQRASQRPRVLTNGETLASWGREAVPAHRRMRQWVAFVALLCALVAYGGVELWLKQHEPERASSGVRDSPVVVAQTPASEPAVRPGAEPVRAPIVEPVRSAPPLTAQPSAPSSSATAGAAPSASASLAKATATMPASRPGDVKVNPVARSLGNLPDFGPRK
jgi:serine/threonine-protein kinase